MKDQEIRIAIAEACGWKSCECDDYLSVRFWNPTQGETIRDAYSCDMLPDYPNDLNAMHEAETTLDKEKLKYTYSHFLYSTVVPVDVQPCRATARQRAEAFLRTIGKWKD